MLRSKATLLALAGALAGVVSGSIAIANADTSATGATGATAATGATGTTTSAPAATIAVNGAGFATIDTSAATTTVQADYQNALLSALTDAHTKASSLATAAGDTLGAVQSIVEQSNDGNGCSGPIRFAAGGVARGVPSPAGPVTHKSHHSKPHSAPASKPQNSTASIANGVASIADTTTTTCMIEADVTVTYAMSPS